MFARTITSDEIRKGSSAFEISLLSQEDLLETSSSFPAAAAGRRCGLKVTARTLPHWRHPRRMAGVAPD
jgi:hypothetical protein